MHLGIKGRCFVLSFLLPPTNQPSAQRTGLKKWTERQTSVVWIILSNIIMGFWWGVHSVVFFLSYNYVLVLYDPHAYVSSVVRSDEPFILLLLASFLFLLLTTSTGQRRSFSIRHPRHLKWTLAGERVHSYCPGMMQVCSAGCLWLICIAEAELRASLGIDDLKGRVSN